MDPSKLNLGLAGYGRATTEPGPYTREGGVLGRNFNRKVVFSH